MTQMEWSPQKIERAGSQIADLQAQASATSSSLDNTISGLGQCWGVMQVGQAFAGKYVDPATQTQQAVADIATFSRKFAEHLAAIAHDYAAIEEANTV